MTEIKSCPECGERFHGHGNARYCTAACKQAAYRRRVAERFKGSRPDTRYLILPAEILDKAIAEVDAHSREDAIRAAGGGELVAVPARNIGG